MSHPVEESLPECVTVHPSAEVVSSCIAIDTNPPHTDKELQKRLKAKNVLPLLKLLRLVFNQSSRYFVSIYLTTTVCHDILI